MARAAAGRKNQKLIDARLRLTSAAGDPWMPQDVAEEMNAFLWARYQKEIQKGERSRQPTTLDHRYVSGYESGRHWWPTSQYRAAWRHALRVETDAELGFTPKRMRRGRPTPRAQAPETVGPATTDHMPANASRRPLGPAEAAPAVTQATLSAAESGTYDLPLLATRRQSMLILGVSTGRWTANSAVASWSTTLTNSRNQRPDSLITSFRKHCCPRFSPCSQTLDT